MAVEVPEFPDTKQARASMAEIVIASVSEAIQLWRRGEKAGLLRRKGASQ
jgi:hypothetical protein